MWICPHCGEQNEDHFEACWKCVSDTIKQHTPALEAPPRRVRPLRSVLARTALGGVAGLIAGALVFHRFAPAEAVVSSVILGLVAAGGVGIFHWVLFPYEPK